MFWLKLYGRRYTLEDMIDTTWSSNLAYAVGLITSDGCLSKDGRHIDFTSRDLEQIQNFKSILKIDNKIGLKYRGKDRNKYYPRIQFGDINFYKFLLSIGLTPRKSKTIEKVRIPRKYFADFLRGCLDGDGYTYSYWDKRWKASFVIYTGFTAGSLKFIKWLRKNINKFYGIKGYIKHSGQSALALMYAKKESLIILKKMYYNNEVTCLSRKRFKIIESLGIIDEQARVSKLVYEQP